MHFGETMTRLGRNTTDQPHSSVKRYYCFNWWLFIAIDEQSLGKNDRTIRMEQNHPRYLLLVSTLWMPGLDGFNLWTIGDELLNTTSGHKEHGCLL